MERHQHFPNEENLWKPYLSCPLCEEAELYQASLELAILHQFPKIQWKSAIRQPEEGSSSPILGSQVHSKFSLCIGLPIAQPQQR
jgi:hypothetical protein